MCKFGSAPKVAASPPPPAPVKPPPDPPKAVDPNATKAYEDEKKNARAAAGRKGTILTGSDLAQTEPNTTNRTLLG